MAAAVRASECGKEVTLLDDNAAAGGQIWRGAKGVWFDRLQRTGARVISGARVIGGDAVARTLRVETAHDAFVIRYDELLLATGARECFLPFPGWTLPKVMGAGGLQALVKNGLPVRSKRIVVAGTGPLLLAVAAYLRNTGAIVPVIAEQASWQALVRFGWQLAGHPAKLWQALALHSAAYSPETWIASADSSGVVLAGRRPQRHVACDYAAVGYGLVPNTELAQSLGCRVESSAVAVDDFQSTTVPGIWCAGEACGIGGVDLAIVEGEIAGYAASGNPDKARRLFPARDKARKFAAALAQTFALRDELREVPKPDTIVCRCEDVRFGALDTALDWRSAKLHLRCGMGPCQGRVCGPAVEFLKGWKVASLRPPVFPARIASLIERSEKQ